MYKVAYEKHSQWLIMLIAGGTLISSKMNESQDSDCFLKQL